jgi:hypothetical protein
MSALSLLPRVTHPTIEAAVMGGGVGPSAFWAEAPSLAFLAEGGAVGHL